MKQLLTYLFTALTIGVFAQPGINVEEATQAFNGEESRNIYKLLIKQAKKQDIVKALEKRLERGTRQEVEVNSSIMTIRKVVYKNFWEDSLVITAQVAEVELGTMCYFAFDLDTQQISSKTHQELDLEIKRYLKSFGLDMYGLALEDEMKAEQKHLKGIEKELKSAHSDSDKWRKKIDDKKLEISNKNEDIGVNKSDRQVKMKEIEQQKLTLANVDASDAEQKQVEKDKLKTMKKELKKFKKLDKKYRKEIFKMENQIRDYELEKEKADKHIESVQSRISDQNEAIETVRKKQFSVQDAKKELGL